MGSLSCHSSWFPRDLQEVGIPVPDSPCLLLAQGMVNVQGA